MARTIGLVAGGLLALVLLCVGGGFFYIRGESPYAAAVERATAHTGVRKALGAPIEADTLFTTKLSTQGDDGVAALAVRLTGSSQGGALQARGVKTSGLWGFKTLVVVADDGARVVVVGD